MNVTLTNEDTTKLLQRAGIARTCPHCLKEYTLGINGVSAGCDRCEGIVRFPNGMIDYSASMPETYITKET